MKDAKACLRCGLVRVTRHDRGLYCRDCVKAARPDNATWMQHAACRGIAYEPEWWWPTSPHDQQTPVALNICRYCKVRDLCLDYAVQHNELEGIWGGTLPEERRRMRATMKRSAS